MRAARRALSSLLYAGYAWAVTVAVGGPAWLLIITLPGLRARRAVLRAAARLLRRLLGIPLTVTGQVPTAAQRFVAVANHASFIDGLALVLCLPGPACFAAAEKFAVRPSPACSCAGSAASSSAHAVPGAGSDFGGRGTGGQPQRQRGMT